MLINKDKTGTKGKKCRRGLKMCSQGVLLYEKVPRQQCTETSWEPVNAGEWKK